MQWSDGPGAGFTTPRATPWLPIGDTTRANVESQEHDPESPLVLTCGGIALRRSNRDLHAGGYASMPAPNGAWAWRRGEHAMVAVNLSDREVALDARGGRVLLGTDHARVGEKLSGPLRLGPWEAVIAEIETSATS